MIVADFRVISYWRDTAKIPSIFHSFFVGTGFDFSIDEAARGGGPDKVRLNLI